jgi:hypothetical protein
VLLILEWRCLSSAHTASGRSLSINFSVPLPVTSHTSPTRRDNISLVSPAYSCCGGTTHSWAPSSAAPMPTASSNGPQEPRDPRPDPPVVTETHRERKCRKCKRQGWDCEYFAGHRTQGCFKWLDPACIPAFSECNAFQCLQQCQPHHAMQLLPSPRRPPAKDADVESLLRPPEALEVRPVVLLFLNSTGVDTLISQANASG